MRPPAAPTAAVLRRGGALLLAAMLAFAPGARAQDPDAKTKEDEEPAKLVPVDPYTNGDAEAMAAAGIVAYGPFPLADHQRTDDVDRVLGQGRVLWVETAHFRIGFNMKSAAWPEHSAARKALESEIKALRKKLPKVPAKPRRIDSWLRMHLTVQRCEKAYGEFLELIGATDDDFRATSDRPGDGRYLGMQDKFVVLMFQKRSDLARYAERFCNRKEGTSMRHYHDKTRQMSLAIAAEGLEGFDESGVHGHLVYSLWHNLMNGYRGYQYPLPHWFAEGIAHCYARRVESQFLNIQVRDDEIVDPESQHKWPVKVRRRAQHDGTWFPFTTMANWAKWEELGYHEHSQSWSRVDYLMHLDRAKVGEMLRMLKNVPSDGTWEGQAPQLRVLAQQLVVQLFELEPERFDKQWREWVLKTYPKK